MTDGFEATFRVRIERAEAWQRLTSGQDVQEGDDLWLPGFDAQGSVTEVESPTRLRATKLEEPCAGTDIVVTLDDDETGTRVHVVQSWFGDWLADHYDMMAIGWRHIVSDLQTSLVTGVHARRHLRAWGDLGATAVAADGGLRISDVRSDALADRLGLTDGDLLVVLAGAPVSSLDDLATVLRVQPSLGETEAEWIRDGSLVTGRC